MNRHLAADQEKTNDVRSFFAKNILPLTCIAFIQSRLPVEVARSDAPVVCAALLNAALLPTLLLTADLLLTAAFLLTGFA